ncbi:MAG: electron transfer flavoprotein subunit alpha/FixB family protein [Ardenticatenaceae bacterium]|nr:electron transfer flavoprotein subunit alpha/FixB family protein [Ardenticatenaceae bacterium]MCB9443500.1 electron transfer flavoprotein subunit alpha/FixB family protein [Ardenticatenaceae bacterium]
MAGILVYSEKQQLVRELLGKARQVADEVAVVVLGESVPDYVAGLGAWGANTVYTVANPLLVGLNPETYTDALAGVIEQVKPDLVLVGATKSGLEISARVAARIGAGVASFCVDFSLDDGGVTADCMIYSGVGKNTYKIKTQPAMATVNAAVFTAVETGGTAEITAVSPTIKEPAMKIVQYKEKAAAGVKWEDAPMIVDVGQGMKEKENLVIAEELAAIFDGQVACSRPVSSERDWFPEWLGLSGKKVHADLTITLGISGSIQHVVGIRDSKTIVAINNDENAGIFSQADYGVVADLHEFVPIFTAALKAKSARLA